MPFLDSQTGFGFRTTDDIDLNEIFYNSILPGLELFNKEVLDIRGEVAIDHDESKVKVPVNLWSFTKLAEGEEPYARRLAFGRFQKDSQKYGLAQGFTFDFLMRAPSADVDLAQAAALAADRELQTQVILAEATATGAWWDGTFNSEEGLTTPPDFGSNTFTGGHTHYVTTSSATPALSDFTNAKQLVAEHGSTGRYIAWHNSVQTKQIEDLAGFDTAAVANPLTDRVTLEGFTGRLLGIDFVETEFLPSGYILLLRVPSTGVLKPMRFIQLKNPSGRGLIILPGNNQDYPIINSRYFHWLAALTVFRSAGVAIQVTTGASYSNPGAPLSNFT